MKLLLENIKELVQVDEKYDIYKAGKMMSEVHTIENAFLIIRDELIQDYGPMSRLKDVYKDDDFLIEIDCSDRLVYPAYCDSHTHIVFPLWREKEFSGYLRDRTMDPALRRKNHIHATSKLLHNISDEQL
ncbi:MAG: imidazolonepropionase, partial [Bacteroidota bacterium]